MRTVVRSGWLAAFLLAAACENAPQQQSGPEGGLPPAGSPAQALLSVSVDGRGSVRSSPAGIDCGSTCSARFDAGTAVVLTANPEPGQQFNGWSGACSGTQDCRVTLANDASVAAHFAAVAPPAPGKAMLSVVRMGSGTGVVISTPSRINCGATCTATFDVGSGVTLDATPAQGSTLVGFGGSCNGTTCALRLDRDSTVYVNFATSAPPTPPPPPPECAGLNPTLPAERVVQLASQFGRATRCQQGESDTFGTVAGMIRNGEAGSHFVMFDSSGTRLRDDFNAALEQQVVPQPDGVLLANESVRKNGNGQSAISGYHYDHRGFFLESTDIWYAPDPVLTAPDRRGGFFKAARFARSETSPASNQVMRYQGFQGPSWGAQLKNPTAAIFALGVDVNGNALVVYDGGPHLGAGAVSAEWFDERGRSLTGEFALLKGFVPGPSTWFDLWPLSGGGLALRRVDGSLDSSGRVYEHTQWIAVAPAGQATSQPAPTWLTDRPNTRLYLARGNRAYALVPEGQPSTDCSQKLEIVAASSGASCGSVDLRRGSGTCRTLGVTVGLDGTVIQQTPAELESGAGGDAQMCSWHYWPGALR